MELARQKEEGERLQEEVARLAQVAAKDQELVPMYFTIVAPSLSAFGIRIPGVLAELLQPFPQSR